MATVTKDKTTDEAPPETNESQEGSQGERDPNEYTNAKGDKIKILQDGEGEEEGQLPHLIEGQRVRVNSGPGTDNGPRMAYVIDMNYESTEELLKAGSPTHPERRFAKVATYDVRTRDGRNEVLTVKPEDIEPLDVTNGWGRGSI